MKDCCNFENVTIIIGRTYLVGLNGYFMFGASMNRKNYGYFCSDLELHENTALVLNLINVQYYYTNAVDRQYC